MCYSRIVWPIGAATGLLYSLGYFLWEVRDMVGEHIPMEPAPVGMFWLFCIGATLGLYAAGLFAPRSRLDTDDGRSLMRTLSGIEDIPAFRVVCSVAVFFLMYGTGIVLTEAFRS